MASTEFLINMTQRDLESMSRAELAKAVTYLNDVATKRVNRIYANKNVYSPSANYIVRTGGFEGVRGKDKEQIQNLYLRVREFLRSKTSTMAGAEKYTRETWERLSEDTGLKVKDIRNELTPDEIGTIYDTLHRMQSLDASIALDYSSEQKQAMQIVYENRDISKDELLKRLTKISGIQYEEKMANSPMLFSHYDK